MKEIRILACLLAAIFYGGLAKAQDSLNTTQLTAINAGIPDDIDTAKFYEFYSKEGIDLNIVQNMQLYYEVFRWYRTCYHYSGTSDKGIDCSGFVQMLYSKVYGVTVPHGSYSIFPMCRKQFKDRANLHEGDFVFFTIRSKKRISHVGVYLQNGKFAHASVHSGVTVSDLDEPYYKKYFYKFGRIE